MSPALRDGDRFLARVVRHPNPLPMRVGDLVVFRVVGDKQLRVKRLAAVAGDPAPVWLPLVLRLANGERVPARQLVVRGDAPVSQDSRELGYISVDHVVAVAASSPRVIRGVVHASDQRLTTSTAS